MNRLSRQMVGLVMGSLALMAQEADPLSALKAQAAAQNPTPFMQELPRTAASPNAVEDAKAQEAREKKERSLDQEIRAMKAKEKGPKRFAADLFEVRFATFQGTEGGIAEDYVLGVGDQLQVNVFGSATFEVPAKVDGRGELVIPKVGTVKVGGLSLAKARQAVQAKVGQNFSRATVDLAVTKLREVRVFVIGEVYKPGSYLVPSLSSLVNVLGMAGGPTPLGSFRQIRVMRGGKAVHTVDLYPLRAEGLGNLNFGFQSGDTVFVPMVAHTVLLEGAFMRVTAQAGENTKEDVAAEENRLAGESEEQRSMRLQIERLEAVLAKGDSEIPALNQSPNASSSKVQTNLAPPPMTVNERLKLQERLQLLKDELKAKQLAARGDQRVPEKPEAGREYLGQPEWLKRWQLEGKAPVMQFEMLPGETVGDALRFAGGFALGAFQDKLTLRRLESSGASTVLDVPLPAGSATPLLRGDVLSALPLMDRLQRLVQVEGWARVPGAFARTEGLRVGDLLKRENQLLADTYRGRGEIVRTLVDGRTRYLAFDLGKALEGDPAHNLLLEDRDRIELHRVQDLRLHRTVTVVGPVARPGRYEFHEGMRASDLLFRAGVPQVNADRLVAELAHTRDGKPSDVRRLDLTRLLSSENASPVQLVDDALNPLIEPFDQLSVFARPDYRPHRSVTLSGQVVRPGVYTLDQEDMGLKAILARAGGLTPDAMVQGAIFLRKMGEVDPEKLRAAQIAGVETLDPTANGINQILERLGETKRQPLTGQLLKTPLLHGLSDGNLNRMVVNVAAALKGDSKADVTLQDGDEIIIPRRTDAAYVVGEAASPFAAYKVGAGMTVRQVLRLAGGTTRNADTWNIRLLKADGRIMDSWVMNRTVEPGDAVLVPTKVKRDVSWQENIATLANLAVAYAAIKK
ncbi:MAG: SLBB domain-containing protein [Firmicutes bacterium]|nr:SLBB domain-containing protein [Bacillota bacterium]